MSSISPGRREAVSAFVLMVKTEACINLLLTVFSHWRQVKNSSTCSTTAIAGFCRLHQAEKNLFHPLQASNTLVLLPSQAQSLSNTLTGKKMKMSNPEPNSQAGEAVKVLLPLYLPSFPRSALVFIHKSIKDRM